MRKLRAAQAVVARQAINFAKGASRTGKNFGKVCAVKSDISELSEGNGEFRKRAERDFGEKRV
ncbi:hypothetical protein [Capnocytophaga ochracea]|uniref:hypothetical protein n=1 Tax=Capnocytophaga ochracea TaxID=1018 RepID=UPI0015EB8977|nr:hypothetical protein [Capnocytophaga ochracea]